MSVLIDIPQIAYKTMSIEYIILDKNGKRDWFAEQEAEDSLRKSLSQYPYSADHDHVK